MSGVLLMPAGHGFGAEVPQDYSVESAVGTKSARRAMPSLSGTCLASRRSEHSLRRVATVMFAALLPSANVAAARFSASARPKVAERR